VLKVDPARALDAQYACAQIIDRINAYFGYRAICEIRLIQAPVLPEPAATRRLPAREIVAPAGSTRAGSAPSGSAPSGSAPAADALSAALARLGAGVAERRRRP
jgi:hypothetical protein